MLYAFDLMPLRGLLGKVAGTLETLDFQWRSMKDSHPNVLLPALSQCSQLNQINFYSNDFSMAILKDLLQHTTNWSKMNVEQYPAPLECYDELGYVSRERFAQLCQELMDTLRAKKGSPRAYLLQQMSAAIVARPVSMARVPDFVPVCSKHGYRNSGCK